MFTPKYKHCLHSVPPSKAPMYIGKAHIVATQHSRVTMQGDLIAMLSSWRQGWLWWWEGNNNYDALGKITLTLCLALLVMSWCRCRYSNSTKGKPLLPPGPRGLPLVGSLPFLGPNLHRCFTELAQSYGPIMKLKLGSKLCIVISSSSLAEEIYRHNDIVFANHDLPIAAKIMSYGGANLVRCPYGTTWRTMRRVFNQELLSNKALDASYHLRHQEIDRMIGEVRSKNGVPINVGELAFTTIFNLLATMLWGKEAIGSDFQRLVMEAVGLLREPNVSDFFPLLARFDVQGIERRMRKCIERLDRIYEAIVEHKMKLSSEAREGTEDGPSDGNDLLSTLLRVCDGGDPSKPLTYTNLKALITDIMVGGTATMSTTVEWVMAELVHKPEIKKRAQEELVQVVGAGTTVQELHVSRLHYLRAILKETLRLHAVVPLLVPRVPTRSCIIGGYQIPQGAGVMTNVWAIHRDPKVWDEPVEFRPERFLNSSAKCDNGMHDFRFFPFGSGRRKCVGLPLVEKVLPVVVATLLHFFEWRVPQGEEIDLGEKFGVTLTKAKPLIAIPVCRFSCNQEA